MYTNRPRSDGGEDEFYLEFAKQYILDHGKNPPRPQHLQGRAIGMWHSKMANLKKSLLQKESPNGRKMREKKKFASAVGDVSLTHAQKSEIKEVLKGLPDRIDCSLDAYRNIGESRFKKEFLQNINGKLEDHIENMEMEEQDSNLDEILFDDLKQKSDNFKYVEMLNRRSILPCNKVKKKILELVDLHQVVLISGETGCGKTTQVPQFLLDHFIQNKKGSLCKIVCTQPRRISAISVAERVADERAESLGKSAGYQIRLEKGIIPNMTSSSKFFPLLSEEKKLSFFRTSMDELESTNKSTREKALTNIWLIICGFSLNPKITGKMDDILLLLKSGVFPLLVSSFIMEYNAKPVMDKLFNKKGYVYFHLNILFRIVKKMDIEKKFKRHKKDVDFFIEEILSSQDKDSFLFILFDIIAEAPKLNVHRHIMERILHLIKLIIGISFGDFEYLQLEKQRIRVLYGLDNDHLILNKLHKISKNDFESYLLTLSLKQKKMNETMALKSIQSLKNYIYIPLSEIQIEDKVYRKNVKIESLYRNMLPKMKKYIQGLLYALCCSPVFRLIPKGEKNNINFENYKMSEENQSLSIDLKISGIFLLLLKHFKLNHIYQFEYLCQEMVACNAIPVMKTYIEIRSGLLEFGRGNQHKNTYMCVKILRVLNKLLKRKHSLVKSIPYMNFNRLYSLTLWNNKDLKVYTSKLLKIYSKILDKRWRQDHMQIMNKIFENVRHRPLENFNTAVQNTRDNELLLQNRIKIFNFQYVENIYDKDIFEHSEVPVVLNDFFKRNYEKWLEREVFQNPFDWNVLLNS